MAAPQAPELTACSTFQLYVKLCLLWESGIEAEGNDGDDSQVLA